MPNKTNHEVVKAKIVSHESSDGLIGKPVVYLSIHRADMQDFILQKGKQPQGIFTIVIVPYGESY